MILFVVLAQLWLMIMAIGTALVLAGVTLWKNRP